MGEVEAVKVFGATSGREMVSRRRCRVQEKAERGFPKRKAEECKTTGSHRERCECKKSKKKGYVRGNDSEQRRENK